MPYLNSVPDDRSKLIYNGIDLRRYGLYVSGDKTFNAPKKEYTKVSIPGRSGDLVISNGRYSNVTLEYDAILIENYEKNTAALRSILLSPEGYVRIEDGYHPDEYRMGVFEGPLDFDTILLEAGKCKLQFNCMPQRWLKNGEEELIIASPQTIVNYTMFDSKPIFKFRGTGEIRCDIQNEKDKQSFILELGSHESDIDCYVDCENMSCYKEGYDNYNEHGIVSGGESRQEYKYTWYIEHLGVNPSGLEVATLNVSMHMYVLDPDTIETTDDYVSPYGIYDPHGAPFIKVINHNQNIDVQRVDDVVIDTKHYPYEFNHDMSVEFEYEKNESTPFELTFGIISFAEALEFEEAKSLRISSYNYVTANEYLTIDEFPVLHPGKTTISITGENATEVSIIPRWYTI